MVAQPFAGLGQADRPPRAVDQRQPELLLEGGDVVGDDRLRIAERQRRLREGASLGHRMECAQAPQVMHR